MLERGLHGDRMALKKIGSRHRMNPEDMIAQGLENDREILCPGSWGVLFFRSHFEFVLAVVNRDDGSAEE